MKLFLSYPSAQRTLADRLALALEAEGHSVFFDRSDLPPNQPFHQRLREAIGAADAMVFLVTPAAVAGGSYALAELDIARQRWRRPGGHVLPVMVEPTPIASLPPYLSAVTLLQPAGDLVAQTVAAVARMAGGASGDGRRWRVAAVAASAAVLLIGALALVATQLRQQRALAAALGADAAAAAQAQALCNDGHYRDAMQQLTALTQHHPAAPAATAGREDCAMRWMRGMRAFSTASGSIKQSFDEQIEVVNPVLLQGLVTAQGARAADLLAHLGWGDALRRREGSGRTDPAPTWQRALARDPGNVYAHAMWAFQLIPNRLAEARLHFDQAVAGQRERPYVRNLQFGASLGSTVQASAYAVQVADEMRRSGEAVTPEQRDRLWTYAFRRLEGAEGRAAIFPALPPPQLKATYDWLFADADIDSLKSPTGRFVKATVQARTGQLAEARAGFEALLQENRRTRSLSYQVVEGSQQALAELGRPQGR